MARQWGPWRFDSENLTLIYDSDPGGWRVDLLRCCTAAQVLDWIAQAVRKDWPANDIGDLVDALDALLGFQENLREGQRITEGAIEETINNRLKF